MSLGLQDVVIASNCQLVTSSWQVVSFVLLNWKFPMLINNTITETLPCNYQVKHIFFPGN